MNLSIGDIVRPRKVPLHTHGYNMHAKHVPITHLQAGTIVTIENNHLYATVAFNGLGELQVPTNRLVRLSKAEYQRIYRCDKCGGEANPLNPIQGQNLCSTCFQGLSFCEYCNDVYEPGEGVEVDDRLVCPKCAANANECIVCGEDTLNGELCSECQETIFICHDCGNAAEKFEEESGHCPSCFKNNHGAIHLPHPKLTGKTALLRDMLFGTAPTSTRDWITVWELIPKLGAVGQTAADFYLLSDLAYRFPDDPQIHEQYTRLCTQTTSVFKDYLTMILGGELRHITASSNPYIDTYLLSLPSVCNVLATIPLHGNYVDRDKFWVSWKDTCDKYKLIPCIGAAMLLYKYHGWSRNYGGVSWGNIAHVLLRYLKHQITDAIFIDTVFGLQHNGARVFDKITCVAPLQSVLEYNQQGDFLCLCVLASSDIQNLWESHEEK